MEKLRNATLVFLIKKSQEEITDICLVMKKRGFGMNRWNGVGGKVNDQKETIEDAAKREAKEEIDVCVKEMNKVAELSSYFPHNPAWNQMVHVYFSASWDGKPKESEEMNPKWFFIKDIPYQDMWSDDIFWLPEVIKGNLLKAKFIFEENDIIQDKEINIVNKLPICPINIKNFNPTTRREINSALKDIKQGKNLSPKFSSAIAMNRYFDSL